MEFFPKHFYFIFLIVLLPILIQAQLEDGIYTIIAPKTLRPNSRYNVGVGLSSPNTVKVLIYLTATINSRIVSTSNEERLIEPGTSSIITLAVGDLVNGATYNLTVQGTEGMLFQNSTELKTSTKVASILIQTDKPLYKPTELIKFRVLLLDRLLRPYGPSPFDIILEDSSLNIIKQWIGVSASRGIFTGEIPLSKEPNLGDWKLIVNFKSQKETHIFTIAEYVLPKFNVEIEQPSFATFSDSKIVTRIRSSYVYGKPVKGEVVVAAFPSIHSSYLQPVFSGIARKTLSIDGTVDVEFDLVKELGLTDDYQRLVTIEATVKETFTNRMQNASKTITLHKYKYKMEIVEGQESFKPGLPYQMTIKLSTQDDVPIQDPNPNALTVKYGFSYNHDEYITKFYPIPSSGLVLLKFDPPKNESVTALGMEASYKDLTEWFPTIQKAISPTNSYLQVNILTKSPRVNDEIEVEVRTTKEFTTLTYQLLGRGDLIISRVIGLPNFVNRTRFRIRVPPLASPVATLLCFTLYESEVVADSVEFQSTGSIENYLNVTLSQQEIEPGKEMDILLKSRPNSVVGIKGIDQSVFLLKEDKDITTSTLQKELRSWSFGKDPSSIRYERSLYAPIGSSTAAKVFDEAGVVILTNAIVHQKPPTVYYRANFLDDAEISPEAEADSSFGISSLQQSSISLKTRKYFPETFIWEELIVGVHFTLISEFHEDTIAKNRPIRPFDRNKVETSSLRPDLGPGIPYSPIRKPSHAGPYAFSRIPRTKLKFPRIFFASSKDVPSSSNWIWGNTSTGFDGRTSLHKTVPDTITSWVISGFSLDSTYGLGVLESPQKLRVFRPFFISLNVPYSIVRGEMIGVQVLVHNYLGRDITAEVTLENNANQFVFTEDDNEIDTKLRLFKTERIGVKANSVGSLSFIITPTKLGPIDLNVRAKTRLAGDSISRPLIVRPPGQTQHVTTSALIDLRTSREFTVNLTTKFPRKRVPDSDSVKISFVSDILGPTIANLDKLLELPTGCGEQNMVHFVPDILILEYLQENRQLNEGIKNKALKYLEEGYQRELSFKHEDGSFSAFGTSDSSGSTWLTAFVARSFIAAKKHIFIDTNVIRKALEWLVSKQDNAGRFPELGKIFDTEIQGGSSNGVALTAYVTIALVEAEMDRTIELEGKEKFSLAKNLAMDYLVKELDGLEDPYTISIVTYLLQISNHPFKDNVFNILESKAILSENSQLKHWERPKNEIDRKNPWTENPKPNAVETTAYALLSYAHRNLIPDALPVVRWLLKQRNNVGGFISTQDTVLGLMALTKFSIGLRSGPPNINIDIIHPGGSTSTQINQGNSVVLDEIILPASTDWVNIRASGSGVGIAQLSWNYNVEVSGPYPLFNLDPQVDKTSNPNQLHLSICTRSVIDETNMAVMEVNVPTGYAFNTDRLPNLLHYPEIKRYDSENSDSKLIVYFNSLNKSDVCPSVSAYRIFPVAKQAPAYIQVYDYYDNSRRARQFYSVPKAKICDICEEGQCSEECRVARLEQENEEQDPDPSDNKSSAIFLRNSIHWFFLLVSIFPIINFFNTMSN